MSKKSCYWLSGIVAVPDIICIYDHTGLNVLLGKNFAIFFFYLKFHSASKSLYVLILSTNIY